MKRIFYLILFVFVVLSTNVYSQEFDEGEYAFAFGSHLIAEGLTLHVMDSGYRIEYEVPSFYEDYVAIGDEVFSVIKFVDDDDFFEMNEVGLPSLPFKSLNLQIPFGREFVETIIDYDVYFEDYEEYALQSEYLPTQHIDRSEDDGSLEKNNDIYDNDVWYGYVTGGVEVSEPYNYKGSTGVTVNLYPIIYNPASNKIRYPSRIIVELPNLSLTTLTYCNHSLYDSFWYDYSNWDRTLFKGDLAIFAHPDYESALEQYVEYKRYCGYRVNTYFDDWSDSFLLRDSIKSIYDRDNGQNLDYVLLVGSPTQIPYSSGNFLREETIPTDMYYACLEQDNIEDEPLTPEIEVGRWPVISCREITNIVEKTIRFENLVGNMDWYSRRTALFSGIGEYAYSFAFDVNKFSNILSNYNLVTNVYDGRSYYDDELFNSLNYELNYNLWMMVYSGHGNYNGISLTDGYMRDSQIGELNNSEVSPISFFFACLTNRLPDNIEIDQTFAMKWILEQNKGGVASFGATTNTRTDLDYYSGKTIFKQLKRRDRNMHLADWLQSSMQRYCNAFWRAPYVKHQVERYVLMGDPTLYIYGVDWFYNPIYRSKQFNTDNNENKDLDGKDDIAQFNVYPTLANDFIKINISENVDYFQIINLNGEIVYSSNNVTDNTLISIFSLSESLYFVKAQTKEGEILIRKIIVKH